MTTTYASDSFDRANSSTAIGTSDGPGSLVWTAHSGTWGIAGTNVAYRVAGTNDTNSYASLTVGQSDVDVSSDIFLSGTNNRALAGLVLRYTDANNLLRVYLTKSTGLGNQIVLEQILTSTPTTLGSVSSAGLANGSTYAVKATITGTTIAVSVDGVERISAKSFNAGLTTQKYGLFEYKGSTDYDDGASAWHNFLVTDNAVVDVFTGYPRPQQAVYRM